VPATSEPSQPLSPPASKQTGSPSTTSETANTELLPPEKRDKPEQEKGLLVLVWHSLRKGPRRVASLAKREPTPIVTAETVSPPPPRRPGFIRRHLLLLFSVLLPTALAVAYFGFYASDIYVTESTYVVRSPAQKSIGQTGIGALISGATGLSGFAQAPDDVHAVSEYIMSRDALQKLNDRLDVRSAWGNTDIDLVQRFDPLGWDSSMEKLFEYYPRRVNILVDDKGGITTLTVSSFEAEHSAAINRLLLGEAERLVNVLNERGRTDLIRFAENEVALAEEKAKAAALAVSVFRNTQAVVDPEKQTMLHFEQIARLQEELIRTRGQLTQLRVFAPDSPHPPALEVQAQTLEREIEAETEKITGGEDSLASKAAEYQRLQLEREFADRQLAVAMAALESARSEAQRQQLYLETIDQPTLPDAPIQPRRLRGILTTFILSLFAWGILALLLAGVREHQH
jgi:capsular polysaccharide transport system permease protein